MSSRPPSTAGGLAAVNSAPATELQARLLSITAAPRWAERLVADRPYPDLATLLEHSATILLGLDDDQIDAALAGHPRIGERATDGDAESAARSAREQAGMDTADHAQTAALAAANAAYEARFGRIYLVAAAGLDAAQLLAIARARLTNDPVAELVVVRGELAKITRTRLTEWLS